jgi:hypothetical protein
MRRGATDMNCGTNEIERGLRRASLVLVDHPAVELVELAEVNASAEAVVGLLRSGGEPDAEVRELLDGRV